MSEKIIAYKGMNADMTCRGKQYEVGKTYTEPVANCCNAGMHACENPFDVLHYYRSDGKNRFFEIECGGDIDREEDKDSKLACTELTVKGELKITDFAKIGVEAVMKRVGKKMEEAQDKASGYCSTGAASGYCSTGAASGDYSTGAASGYYSTGAASGHYSTGAASGYCSTGAASGYCSTGAASGDCSTGAASGDCSTGAASGDYSTGAASGDCSKAEATGKDSIAVANGAHSKARGAIGCYLVLTEYDDDGEMVCAKMAQVDGTSIEENVWYTLKNGEFVEVES